jgi:glycosyltransferase involved in cell wall biosynthesis
MKKQKILIGVPPKTHVSLAQDEIDGFTELGYECLSAGYSNNNQSIGVFNKLMGVISNAFKLLRVLYKFKPSILYLNSRFETVGGTRDFITLLILKSFYYRKLSVTVKSHGSDHSILQKKSFVYKNLIVPVLVKYVDIWFFLSQEEKDLVNEFNPAMAKKIVVTPNIIDPSRSVPSEDFKKQYNLVNDKYNLLFVGRMVAEKGIYEILNCIPLLACRSEVFFTMVGDGTDLQIAKDYAEKIGVTNEVQFIGFVPDVQCDHFYANTDALIFPTYHTEGFAMALFKSVAKGIPVITTPIRAAKDYLHEPENVIWVKEKSPESNAVAVDRLLADKNLQQTIGANNLILGRLFSRQIVCKQMADVFDSLN